MRRAVLELSRSQLLGFRRRVGALEARLPHGAASLRQAAWAGLQDSMPRAALLSIHARVEGTGATAWEDPSLVQVWGPRFSVYTVAAQDLPIFTLGRLPRDARGRARARATAARLHAALAGRRLPFGEAGRTMGVVPNSLRYAAATGTVLIRWDGARQPTVWTVPEPDMAPEQATWELARRHLHTFGVASAEAFARWAGIAAPVAARVMQELQRELIPVRVPTGDGWALAVDEAALRSAPGPLAPARLLPSGDTYYLLWGADRELLVPDARHRAALWTARVWPGALLVNGEIVGVWRRAATEVSLALWRRLSAEEREAVEAEASSLPLPGFTSRPGAPVRLRWTGLAAG